MTSPARPAEGAPLLSAHRSTPAIAAFLGGAVALYVLGSTVGDSWVLLAACLLGAVPLAAALLTPKPHRMVVKLRLPTRPTAGQPMRAVVSVRACSHGSSEARLTVTHPALLPVEILVPALAPNGVAAVEVQVVAPSRGAWIDAPIAAHIDMWSPWRLWSRRLTLLLSPLSLFVRPPAAAPWPHPPLSRVAGDEQSGPRHGHGLDIYGVRDWNPGDPASAVHWRTSARHGRLAVLERSEYVDRTLVIVVAILGVEPAVAETLLAHAYATATRHIEAGGTVHLVAAASAATTRRSRDVGDWFASVTAATEPADAVLAQATRRGAEVLWIGAPPSAVACAALRATRLTVADRLLT